MRVIIVYLLYNPTKYGGWLSACKDALHPLSAQVMEYLVVDNAHPGQWTRKEPNGDIWIGGDNEAWEFSGWQKALQYLRKKRCDYDVLVLCNDAFRTNIDEYQRYLSAALLQYVSEHQTSAGVVQYINSHKGLLSDFVLKSVPFKINGLDHYNWARSNIIIIPYKKIISIKYDIYHDRDFFPSEYTENVLAEVKGISKSLKKHIVTYLCPGKPGAVGNYWHARFNLDALTYPIFCKKATSIINELHLSRVLHDNGCPVVDFRLIGALRLIDRKCKMVSNMLLKMYVKNQNRQNQLLFIYAVVVERKGVMHKIASR